LKSCALHRKSNDSTYKSANDSIRILRKKENKEEPISFIPNEMENLVKETSARF